MRASRAWRWFSRLLWPSPARLRHTGDTPLGGKVAEADAAHAELPVISARPSADAASVMEPDLELRVYKVSLPALECRFLRQAFYLPLLEWHAEAGQKTARLVVGAGRGHYRH